MKAEEYYKDAGDGGIAADTLRKKYLTRDEDGPEEMWQRIAQAIASVEKPTIREKVNADFLWALTDFRFIPGGRIMHGAGTSFKSTLTNCYVNEIKDDSIAAIYDTLGQEAITYKFGGGVGHDLSVLRPRSSAIGSTGGESCGPVGFMNLFSENTNTISQHGRRGANMQTLRVDHPDIEEFIQVKADQGRSKVQYSNISVLITDEFMKAVEEGTDFPLRWGSKVYRSISARDLWEKIITMAHESAEPGIIFWDRMKTFHNLEYATPLVSTNPCGEQPLPDGGNCNLGSINLAMMVKPNGTPGKWGIDFECLDKTTRISVRYLDDVIDYNMDRHPLEAQRKNAGNQRRMGLGITGLADMLVKLQLQYDSEEALQVAETVMERIRDVAYLTSIELAEEKGSFPDFNWTGYKKSEFVKSLPSGTRTLIREKGIRNGTLLTIAPVGTGSIVATVSSGIEPIFKSHYNRRVRGEGDDFTNFVVYHPLLYRLFISKGAAIPEYVRESHQIDPHFRVRMQGKLQKYVDSSISSTVNLAEDVAPKTVRDIYEFAYTQGLKGITVYREGSRDGILQSIDDGKKQSESKEVAHPYLTGELINPVPRPQRVYGWTEEVSTGVGDMLVTLNVDEEGRIVEVIARVGKAGGNEAAQSEGLGRVLSVALRCGVDPRVLVKQLGGITADPVFHMFEGSERSAQILSTPDAIAQVIRRYLDSRENDVEVIHHGSVATSAVDVVEDGYKYGVCPDCQQKSVINEGGCDKCTLCGYSKCSG